MSEPQPDQKINLTINKLGINGEGVGNWHGYTVFVNGTLPNEVVQTQIIERNKKYGKGLPLIIDNPSPFRVKPSCALFGQCGGCQLMHLDYEQQLNFKTQRVQEALEKSGKIYDVEVMPCQPSPRSLSYRNKIQMPVSAQGQAMKMGLYAQNSHELIDIDKCVVHCDLGEKTFHAVKKIIKNSSLEPYNASTNTGNLRYLLIKSAVKTQEVLVILVTARKEPECLEAIANEIMDSCPAVKGVVQNINGNPGNRILGKEINILKGSSFIEEDMNGLYFKISSTSFFQVNPYQAEYLYAKALELSNLSGKETVLDAYCGVGTLSIYLAAHAKHVIGVECIEEAIADANENASRNGIKNVSFVCAKAEDYIPTLRSVDVIFLNPPRKGCDLSFLKEVGRLKPQQVVYISCEPSTLARDLAILCQFGYRIESVHPFDMFPQTAHVETVVKLRNCA